MAGNAARLIGAMMASALCTGQIAAAEPDRLICGFENVEDLVAVPGTPWLIGSGIGDAFFQRGGLHVFHSPTATGRKVLLDFDGAQAQAPYAACPSPPDPDAFSAHGISLAGDGDGGHRLFVVNHGGRETIEVFDVIASDSDVSLQWIGCVEVPETAQSNAVSARADGSLVMSASSASDKRLPQFHEIAASGIDYAKLDMTKMAPQNPYGAVFAWTPGSGWSRIADSALEGNNGIELSDDGKWAFVNSWPGKAVVHMPLDPRSGKAREIALDFNPDNIRRADDGRLVAAGHAGALADVATCVLTGKDCAIDYRAAAIDPETFEVETLFEGTGSADFGAATVALMAGDALWFGSVRSDCIARVDLGQGD